MAKSSTCSDKSGLKKGPWTAEEDEKLIDYIQKHGHGRWRTLPKNAGLKRCGKSCRLRWINYLRPDIKRGKFSYEEEEIIIKLHSVLGNKWSTIAARLPGRTDNEIKNYWNTHIKKKLLRMGIDPVTHKPRLDLLQLYSVLNSSLSNSSLSSHQLNLSSLPGLGSLLNPNLLNLATSLLSSQDNSHSHDVNLKSFHENNIPVIAQLHDQFQSSEANQVQNQIHTYTDSSSQLLNQTQFTEINLEQLYDTLPITFSWQNPLQHSWPPASGEPTSTTNCDNRINSQSTINTRTIDNLPNFGFTSLLSTTSCSTTPLNSSSTTHVNGSTEDEKDSYCSNMFMFGIPCSLELDVSGLL
ncbi:hypothetical protein K2173_003095 [Erythroxylum novogranatense]|uniref:Uncharacterized protein n=1 Tax=Erythroxylum novogranatense TaxID=1862640 RepID=A0AAV8TBX9_9ROSI|nr:hypothetical protein K2173_003095 [Erythroxylum novogranatense]